MAYLVVLAFGSSYTVHRCYIVLGQLQLVIYEIDDACATTSTQPRNNSPIGPTTTTTTRTISTSRPVRRFLLLHLRNLLCVLESFFLGMEHLFLWIMVAVQSVRSGKNVGRNIFTVLIVMVVMSVIVKVSLISCEVNGKSIETGQLILQQFKEDWASAHQEW